MRHPDQDPSGDARGRLIQITKALGLAALVLGLGCSPDRQVPASEDKPQVELFSPGVVSTELPEFATTFSPSGDTVFFNRMSADRSRIDLLYSVRKSGAWSAPAVVSVAERVRVIDPFISADGKRLYFSSDSPVDGDPATSFNLWYAERTPSGWGDPVPLPRPINSDSSDVFNSFADDGTMVFSSRRDGIRRVYSTRLENWGWSDPVLLHFGDLDEGSNPAISPAGNLIVISARSEGEPPDLHVSCRSGSDWTEPRRLPEPVNSPYTEFAPGFTPTHLYFTSERPGTMGAAPDSVRPPGDIYRTPRAWIDAMCP